MSDQSDAQGAIDSGDQGAASPPVDWEAKAHEREADNAKLRSQLREEHAAVLGGQYGLTAAQIARVAEIDRDKQEEWVKDFAPNPAARTETEPATTTEPTPEPTTTPAPDAGMAAMGEGGEGVTPPPPAQPSGSSDPLEEQLKAITPEQGQQAITERIHQAQREAREKLKD